MRASLDNLDNNEGFVTVCLQGEGAAAFAKNLQSFKGCHWESDGPDFAYCLPVDSPELLDELSLELDPAIEIDDCDYCPPDPIS